MKQCNRCGKWVSESSTKEYYYLFDGMELICLCDECYSDFHKYFIGDI